MPRKTLLAFFALGLCAATATLRAAEPEDPWLLLEKAGQAARQLNYKGVFVYQSGRTVNAMQITHMNYVYGEFVRVVALDGVPREMLRQDNEVVIYNAQNEKVTIDRRRVASVFPSMVSGMNEGLRLGYQARVAGQERVGGRDGMVIHLEPRDRYRYGHRLCVDREFGLLLKSAMMGERNDVVEQVAFHQINFIGNQENMDWFRPSADLGKTYVMKPEEQVMPDMASDEGWTLTALPPGYRKVDQVRRSVPGKPVAVTHLVFSDGLASVSLFIERIGKDVPKVGHTVRGATHVVAQVADGYQTIAVGEAPLAAVQQISAAVSFRKK